MHSDIFVRSVDNDSMSFLIIYIFFVFNLFHVDFYVICHRQT